jgi:pimeloyl-ACP methyl ester carboxylesterase
LNIARNEPLILVGHSIGGLVARVYLVHVKDAPVKALITIASPHLGTPLAGVGQLVSKTPLNGVRKFLGGEDMKKSRQLFMDINKEEPGSYLFWLNRQTHPDIQYISVVRKNAKLRNIDFVVPPRSQNMNAVWALQGRSAVLTSDVRHFLSVKDGIYVRDLLNKIK